MPGSAVLAQELSNGTAFFARTSALICASLFQTVEWFQIAVSFSCASQMQMPTEVESVSPWWSSIQFRLSMNRVPFHSLASLGKPSIRRLA